MHKKSEITKNDSPKSWIVEIRGAFEIDVVPDEFVELFNEFLSSHGWEAIEYNPDDGLEELGDGASVIYQDAEIFYRERIND